MKQVSIYCAGGTTWQFKTDDYEFIDQIHEVLNNPKNKTEFIRVEMGEGKTVSIRKSHVNIVIVESVQL